MRFPETFLGSPLAPKASVPQRHVCSNTKITGPPAPPARQTLKAGCDHPPPPECQGNSAPALLGQHITLSLHTLGPPGIKRKESVPSGSSSNPPGMPPLIPASRLYTKVHWVFLLSGCWGQSRVLEFQETKMPRGSLRHASITSFPILLRESQSKRSHTVGFCLHGTPSTGKATETEYTLGAN